MRRLLQAYDRHGRLPWHVLVAVGLDLGVAPRSVETRYYSFIRRLAEEIRFAVSGDSLRVMADSITFADASAQLAATRPIPPPALVDRALWTTPSLALVKLRVAERARRRRASEAGTCPACQPPLAMAA